MTSTNKNITAVVLFSGGLDSTLAVRILQEQGIHVEGINYRTPFGCCTEPTKKIAAEIGIQVTYLNLADDYLRVIENPEYNYGRGVNPCIDCRIHMFRLAKKFMDDMGAHFIASGEVVGQRPNSQRKNCLKAIQNGSLLDDLLLRPLSAKILPPTLPEIKGWVDRNQLYSFSGRGRKPLIQLGKELGLKTFPSPSTGCLLTDKTYAKRVNEMWQHKEEGKEINLDQYEILKVGRHFRLSDDVKITIGKNKDQNDHLLRWAQPGMTLYKGHNFKGPIILATTRVTENAQKEIGTLMVHYCKDRPNDPQIQKIPVGTNDSKVFSSPATKAPEETLSLHI